MTDGTNTDEGIVLPNDGDAAFTALMDVLAPEPDEPAADASTAAPAAPAGGAPVPAAPGEGAAAGTGVAPAPAGGAAGSAAPAGGAAPVGGAAEPGADQGSPRVPEELTTHFGEVSKGIETKLGEQTQNAVLGEVRQEYGKYFDALEQHPRLLVGIEVPKIDGSGMEVLRDSADAKEWQDAVRQALVGEVRDRVGRRSDDDKTMRETLQNTVLIFQNNAELIPDTPAFDEEFANRFAAAVKPYEVKLNDALVGWQVPVQPFIDSVRAQLKAERAAANPAAPAAPTAQQQRAAEAARNAQGQFQNPDGPQAGIPSQAGQSSDTGDDFSALFGTLGLPGLRI